MKRLLTFALTLLLLFSLSISAAAAGNKIVDQSGLLTAREVSSLESRAESIAQTYQMDVVIVTVDSLGNKTPSDFADDYFDNNGYGYGDDASGILLLVSMEERDWAVSTCGMAERIVTDPEIDTIMEEVLPYLSSGSYRNAFDAFLDGVEAEYEAGPYDNAPLQLLISIVIGAVVALIAVMIMRGRMNTAKAQHGAASYIQSGSYDLYRCQDFYLYSRTTKVRKSDSNGSGSHRSSSGRSHGGRSGKF